MNYTSWSKGSLQFIFHKNNVGFLLHDLTFYFNTSRNFESNSMDMIVTDYYYNIYPSKGQLVNT